MRYFVYTNSSQHEEVFIQREDDADDILRFFKSSDNNRLYMESLPASSQYGASLMYYHLVYVPISRKLALLKLMEWML